MTEKITHYVPGNWGGHAFLTAICGERVIYYQRQLSQTALNAKYCGSKV